MIAIIAFLPATGWGASAAFYTTINNVATPVSGTQACQAAQTAAVAECQSVYQQQTQNMQNNMQKPGSLSSQSCLGSLLSTTTGMFSNIQSLASGGGIAGLLSSLGSTLMQQFSSSVCSAITSQWDNVSSQLDQVANLPTTLGEAAAGEATQLGQAAGSAVTAPITNANIPQVVPNTPDVPLASVSPSSGKSGGISTSLDSLL